MLHVTPPEAFVPFPSAALAQSIPARFEHVVRCAPQQLAVKTRTQSLTYAALNARANQIAHALLAQRGPTAEPIAILLETDVPALTAILGVLKTGKFYTLLDLAFPDARLTAIMAEVQPGVLLTTTPHLALAQTLADGVCAVWNLDTLAPDVAADNPDLTIAPESLADITYTSGSTGRPKGVLQQHRTILHGVLRVTNALALSPTDRITLFTSLNTGQGCSTMYRALLNGATLYPWKTKDKGVTDLVAWLRQEAITLYYSSVSLFRAFVSTLRGQETFPALRLIRVGSETVAMQDVALYRAHFPPSCLLFNTLSSTETNLSRAYILDHATPLSE